MKKALLAVLAATVITYANADQQQECLARNIYFEARGEPFKGKLAVAQVTLNRLASPLYPNSICRVVYQPKQFSWTNNPGLRVRDQQAWKEAQNIARLAKEFPLKNFKDVLWFHNLKVRPQWSRKLTRQQQIGNHVFYRQG